MTIAIPMAQNTAVRLGFGGRRIVVPPGTSGSAPRTSFPEIFRIVPIVAPQGKSGSRCWLLISQGIHPNQTAQDRSLYAFAGRTRQAAISNPTRIIWSIRPNQTAQDDPLHAFAGRTRQAAISDRTRLCVWPRFARCRHKPRSQKFGVLQNPNTKARRRTHEPELWQHRKKHRNVHSRSRWSSPEPEHPLPSHRADQPTGRDQHTRGQAADSKQRYTYFPSKFSQTLGHMERRRIR